MLPWALQSMTLFPSKGRLRYGCCRNRASRPGDGDPYEPGWPRGHRATTWRFHFSPDLMVQIWCNPARICATSAHPDHKGEAHMATIVKRLGKNGQPVYR